MRKSRRSWMGSSLPRTTRRFPRGDILGSSVQGQDGPDKFPTDMELSGYSSWSHAPFTHSDNLPPFPPADWLVQTSCNVHKTLILLYCESAYVVYKNLQNGANYKWMGPLIHWASPWSSVLNQTCKFHIVNQKKCASDSPCDLKCKGCQFPLKILKNIPES